MAHELARNLQDASLNPVAIALPAAASSSIQSAVIDLGADTYKPEDVELQLSVPALTTTMVPDTRTVNYIIETSATSVFTTVAQTINNDQVAGAAGAGVAAYLSRVRLPSNCARFVRCKITLGASCTDSSAVSATLTARF